MRVLYLHPEEWTGRQGREVHVLSTCVALAESGVDVTLVTAGGEPELLNHLVDIADAAEVPGLHLVALSRTLGPVQSTSIFSRDFAHWLQTRGAFDLGVVTNLKAGPILSQMRIPYVYEAHEIFTQASESHARQKAMHKLEGQVLSSAALHVATSAPLAVALTTWFSLSREFAVVPSAGLPPLSSIVSAPHGPFVYCGSIGDGSELTGLIEAVHDTGLPLKIIGGTEEEWTHIAGQIDVAGITWQPRVPLHEIPEVLAGARAGLIPTNASAPAHEYACPVKIFDYARCGLPVLTTPLAALQSLDLGPWCTLIPSSSRFAWKEALKNFHYQEDHAEAARQWSGEHTWARRAELMKHVFGL
jgi:hypothetical protein